MNELETTFLHRNSTARCSSALAISMGLALAASPAVTMGHGRVATVETGAWGAVVAPVAGSDPLRIQVEPSIDDASVLPGWIRERQADVAEKVPTIKDHQQWISVEIGGATYDYRVSVVAMRDGMPLGAKEAPEVCVCTTEKLLDLVDTRIAAAVEDLRAAPPPEKVAVPEPTVEPEPEPDPTTEEKSRKGAIDDHGRSIGPMGYVGIGLGVLGLGLLGAGIPLALRSDELRGEPPQLSSYSTRPPGIGLAAGGGAALVGGVALIVVDVVRRRKASVAVLPAVGRGHAGLFFVRKF